MRSRAVFLALLLTAPAAAADRLPPGAVARLGTARPGQRTDASTHTAVIRSLAFTPDGRAIVTGSEDRTIRVWNAATGEHLRELPGHRSGVNAVAVTADGTAVVSCGTDAVVPLRELATGNEIRRFDLRLPAEGKNASVPHQVIAVMLSADGTRLSAYSRFDAADRAAYHCWEVATGQSLARRGFKTSPSFLGLVPDGRSVLEYVSPPNSVRNADAPAIPLALRDLGTGRTRRILTQPEEFELKAASSSDGLTLAAVTSRQYPRSMDESETRSTIRVWDSPSGREYLALGGPDGFLSAVEVLAFSPDGRWLASAHSNRSVFVWDTRTGTEVMTIAGLDSLVRSLAFSRDGRRLATGHTDGTALVWTVRQPPPAAGPPTPAQLDAWWAALGNPDAGRARTAMARLAEYPKETLALFARRLAPASEPPAEKIKGWLNDLSHPRFATRETATRALAALGERAEPMLIDFLATGPPPEASQRAERLLTALPPVPPPDTLRRLRAGAVRVWISEKE